MLVLSRSVGQKILIHRNGELLLEIYLTEIRGESVRLSFSSMPEDVIVTRAELDGLYERPKGDQMQGPRPS